jgi:hypothetical protein
MELSTAWLYNLRFVDCCEFEVRGKEVELLLLFLVDTFMTFRDHD